MSAFKDCIKHDITRVFINLDEFADYHNIDGVNIGCIVDKDLTSEFAGAALGVFINTITLYIREGDISAPVEGEIISLDGSLHLVKSVSVEGGVLVIVAEANEQ